MKYAKAKQEIIFAKLSKTNIIKRTFCLLQLLIFKWSHTPFLERDFIQFIFFLFTNDIKLVNLIKCVWGWKQNGSDRRDTWLNTCQNVSLNLVSNMSMKSANFESVDEVAKVWLFGMKWKLFSSVFLQYCGWKCDHSRPKKWEFFPVVLLNMLNTQGGSSFGVLCCTMWF